MKRPYVGITDFTTYEQVPKMLEEFNKYRKPGSNRRLHVGVMMSFKTLYGLETKWSKIFPPKETIADIFRSEDTMNCLHYADYGKDTELGKALTKAIYYGGEGITALQLDMVWPDPGQVAHGLQTSRRNLEVILQIGQNALDLADNVPDKVVDRLREYEGIITHVLLDKSMGRGIGLDAAFLFGFARRIRDAFPDLEIGVAGGLGPGSVYLVEPMFKEFPNLNVDAQSKLRPSESALDPIDWDMAAIYLGKILEMAE